MANIADLQNDQNALVLRTLGAIFAIPNGIEAADPVREQAGQLVALANGPGSEIRDDRIKGWLLDRAGDRMFGAGRTMHGLMREHLRTYQERDARMREPLPSIDRKADAERRARFSAMEDAGTLMQSIMAADLADLTALVADGNIAALSHDAWREAQKQFLVLNTVARTGMQADFAGKPTLENPLPDGPDVEGARRQAEAVLDSHDADRQVIDTHRRVIQDYAGFLGHVFGIAPGQAFERMAA